MGVRRSAGRWLRARSSGVILLLPPLSLARVLALGRGKMGSHVRLAAALFRSLVLVLALVPSLAFVLTLALVLVFSLMLAGSLRDAFLPFSSNRRELPKKTGLADPLSLSFALAFRSYCVCVIFEPF